MNSALPPPTSEVGGTMLGLLLVATAAATGTSLPLESTSYTVDVTGPLAEVVIRQTFRNRSDTFVDATYLFPLDNDAVVDGMVMHVGGRTIRSDVMAREEARAVWEEAAANGQVAALTEQQRPNVFTQDVSNLPPGEPVEVELRLVQPVDRVDGAWELVLPLVVAPRFVRPGDAAGQAVLASYFDPEAGAPEPSRWWDDDHRALADLDVVLHATAPIHGLIAPHHEPAIALDGADASVVVDGVAMDRDFVLRWRTDGDLPQLGVLKSGDHALLMMEAPAVVPRKQRAPREIVWVVDTSGSMAGDKIALAKRAMLGALGTMDARDSFVVLGFGDRVVTGTRGPVAANVLNVAAGRAFVSSLEASGGTWMELALHEALAFPDDPARRRMVVFLTDGQIGHDTELLGKIAKASAETTFVALGIGPAPNRYLLDEMARLGGGVSAYAEGPGDLEALVATMDRPVLTDFRIDWGDCGASLVAPQATPPLRPGHPVHLLARIEGPCTEPVVVKALGDCEMSFRLATREVPHERAMASTFARARVADLERRAMRGEFDDPGPEVEAIGLEYGIVTSRTSRVAVDDRIVNPGGRAEPAPVPLESTEVAVVLQREFLHRIPAGRTYQSAIQTVPGVVGGGGGNPNMAGGASAENTYLLDGANIVVPVSGTFSMNYSHDGMPRTDALSLSRLPEIPGGPAGLRVGAPIPDTLQASAEVRGAALPGDPTAGGSARAAVAGAVVPDRVWLDLDVVGRQSSLGGASALGGRTEARLAVAPSFDHRLHVGGVAAPGRLDLGGRRIGYGTWGADGGWTWALDGGAALDLDGTWGRRTLGDTSRDHVGAEAAVRTSIYRHRGAVGAGFSRSVWADGAGRWDQDLVGLFAQDVWELGRGLRLSGGLRVDVLSAPGLALASPRLLLSADPGGDGRTTLAAGFGVYRDPKRLLPSAFADVRLPADAELLLLAERELGRGTRVSLSGTWSHQRFAFAADPKLLLLPGGWAPTVVREAPTLTASFSTTPHAVVALEAAWHLRPRIGDGPDEALLADPTAPFVPDFLAAYRTHAADVQVRFVLPWNLALTTAGRWAGAVALGDGDAWWRGPQLTAAGRLEQGIRVREGSLALTAGLAVSSNDPAASVLPLEAYTLGLLPVRALGDQPLVRGEIGLTARY